jgi:predicted dehydrogenase
MPVSSQIAFGVVGSGWRAEFFLRAAKLAPDRFRLCGVVTTNKERAGRIAGEYGTSCYASAGELLAASQPEFMVVSVTKSAAMGVSLGLLEQGVAVLAETPPANTVDDLAGFFRRMPAGARLQVAEQYFLRPDHAARLNYLQTGKLGRVHQARVSLTNSYHGISLIRKYLGLGFENAEISARSLVSPVWAGFSRTGEPEKEQLLEKEQLIAVLDFGGKAGIFDFESDQHRSWVRSQQILVKGERGELNNHDIRYLLDYKTPVQSEFRRVNLGEVENMEGAGLKGILADGQWFYRNPFPDSRMTDDETAVAECLARMSVYVNTGKSFYSFAEAAQDFYLSELMAQSAETGGRVRSQTQVWAG